MLGNDVVDLREAARPRHPGFDARVFGAEERRRIQAAPGLRWAFWAAKEAAYKRARRADPGVVFSPVRFEVTIGADGRGRVRHAGKAWAVRVERSAERIHAVAADTADGTERARAGVASLRDGADPSAAVRRLALRELAPALGVAPDALRIERRERVPWLYVEDGRPAMPLSLSHHGRFIAWAWLAPGGGPS